MGGRGGSVGQGTGNDDGREEVAEGDVLRKNKKLTTRLNQTSGE